MKKLGKQTVAVLLFGVSCAALLGAQPSFESEKLALEITMQKRVEAVLSKIIEPSQFVVVIRVEPWSNPTGPSVKAAPTKSNDGFFLPGVPVREQLGGNDATVQDLMDTLKPGQKSFMHFVRRITATLVLDSSLPEADVEKVRNLTRQILGLNAERGDTLDLQKTVFPKPESIPMIGGISRLQSSLKAYWVIISLALILFCITVFFLFVFGPLRGFLNRFVQVLPTLKPIESEGSRGGRFGGMDPNALPALLAQAYGMLPPPQAGGQGGGANPSNFSGSLMVENPNKRITPFGFIREDHLGNLATLLMRETPEKAAVILGYLPAEWTSRVLSKMDGAIQSDITEHLAVTRQMLPEQVEDIEQDLKRRLDYLIGGPDRIIAVYESLDPVSQKQMLDNLKNSRPELVQELRQHTFLFEDLERLEPSAQKILFREVEMQTLVMSMRGMPEEFRGMIMKNLSPGKAEIISEELEFGDGPAGSATLEAQRQVILLAKRLEREGQIQLPRADEPSSSTRYGSSLSEHLKLPTGFGKNPGSTPASEENIESKIQEFMGRNPSETERFPIKGEDTQILPPDSDTE